MSDNTIKNYQKLTPELEEKIKAEKRQKKKELHDRMKKLDQRKKWAFAKLSWRQKGFLYDWIVHNLPQKQAYKLNYSSQSDGAIKQWSKDLKNSESIQKALTEIFEEEGITREKLAKVTKEWLEATQHVYEQGQIVDKEPDHKTRHKFLKTAMDLYGGGKWASENGNWNTYNYTKIDINDVSKTDQDMIEVLQKSYKKKGNDEQDNTGTVINSDTI